MTPADIGNIPDPSLHPIAEKILSQTPLSHADGVTLFSSPDLHSIGRLAHHVRTTLHGNITYYNRNRHINYTNVCALSCKFCSFYRKRGEDGAYEMPLDQVIATAQKAADAGATEVHIVGGLHPWLKFDYYLDMLRGIRTASPNLHIKAFTAIEIVHFSRISHQSIHDVLAQLKEAGLGSLPGGGAEIFDDRVHDEIFKGKVRADKWFDVHRTAHSLGIFSNATMLYGHVETTSERVTHLIQLRELQAESLALAVSDEATKRQSDEGKEKGDGSHFPSPSSPSVAPSLRRFVASPKAFFNCAIPLSFIPDGSELGHLPGNTGLSDLKTLAISRLMLHNISHIKAFWIMQSIPLSQIALNFGCDDLDGTVTWYDITKGASGSSPANSVHQHLHISDIHRLIRQAGFTPVERDTLYHPISRELQPS